jgi:hypothetical protein
VEALEAEWQKVQEQANQTPDPEGPTQHSRNAAQQPPTLDDLRKLHQKYEKHEEQVDKAQRQVDYYEAQLAKVQASLDKAKAHLAYRDKVRNETKRAFDEADLRHRVERPVGALAEDSESQIVAATAWVAAKAGTAGQERPPREVRRTFRSLQKVWNAFATHSFDSSNEEDDDEDDEASAPDDGMEGKSGTSTPKGGAGAGSPLPGEGSVSGAQPRHDQDTGECISKAAKTRRRWDRWPPALTRDTRCQLSPPLSSPAAVRGREGEARATE